MGFSARMILAASIRGGGESNKGRTNVQILTVTGKPLCLVNARRQGRERKHVCVCDPVAHVRLLQIWALLLIIVIDSPEGDSSTQVMTRRQKEKITRCKNFPCSQDETLISAPF